MELDELLRHELVALIQIRLDEASEAVVTHQRSLAPRGGYKPGDPVMKVITCQL